MGREHKAVLAGKYRNLVEKRNRGPDEAIYTLRRNTHRLEKGLIMRPRREVFADGYILETVRRYQSLLKREDQALLLGWSHDVLSEYFRVVGTSENINESRRIFSACVQPSVGENEGRRQPYIRDFSRSHSISIEDMLALAKFRRSCRWFKQQQVPRSIIDMAMTVAGYSPSACNRQPFNFRIFDDPTLAQKFGSLSMGTSGFAQNFPALAVIVGDLSAFPDERDRHVPYIDASLAAMAFQFALEVQGVSSCCINWPDVKFRDERIERELGLKADERVVMLMAFGYPEQELPVPFSQKKRLEDLRSYNQHAS